MTLDGGKTSLAGLALAAAREAVKTNWADFYVQLGRSPVAELTVGPHLSWLLTGIPDAFLNAVFRAELPSDQVDELIDEALSLFRERRVTRLSWWAEETDGEVGHKLLARGLVLDAGGTAMAADLGSVPERAELPPDVEIVPVEDHARLAAWVHLICVGFGIPEWAEPRMFQLFAPIALEPAMFSYLALLEGRPVATSQLFLGTDVAGIYNVTTLPEVRGRGIGRAITHTALAAARRHGYRLCILQASDLGRPVYRRLGFQDLGRLPSYTFVGE